MEILIGFSAVVFVIILVCRSIALWYFKIEDIIAKQNEIIAETKRSNDVLKQQMIQSAEIAKKQLEQQEFTNTLLQDLLKK